MTLQIIQPFREGEDIETRKAKIRRINAITEAAANALTRGDDAFARAIHADLEAAGVLVNPDNPTLWIAEEQP